MSQFLLGVLIIALDLLAVSRATAEMAPSAGQDVATPAVVVTPFCIETLQDLRDVGKNLSGHHCLAKDIDASPTKDAPFTPIGSDRNPFVGEFDGNGHVIDGLTTSVVPHQTICCGDYTGLFAVVGKPGIVRNVGVTNGSSPNTSVVGLLIALNDGTVTNCFATGAVAGFGFVGGLIGWNRGLVMASHAQVSVAAAGETGGLVGFNDTTGTIKQSYASGRVSGRFVSFGSSSTGVHGGFIGDNRGTIIKSYATGDVIDVGSGGGAGGFAGYNTGGTISQSYATGNVKPADGVTGGFVSKNIGTISQSYSVGFMFGKGGGFVGLDFSGSKYADDYWDVQSSGRNVDGAPTGTTGLTTAQLKSGLPSGFDPAVWGIYPPDVAHGLPGTYPYLKWQKAFLVSFPVPAAPTLVETKSRCLQKNKCTAYNANIASAMDHAGTPLDPNPTTRLSHWYQENLVAIAKRTVTAYTGETGTWTFGRDADSLSGYKMDPTLKDPFGNPLGPNFGVNGNYVGASLDATNCGIGVANCTCKATKTCAKTFLNYDGHPGYDYPFSGTTITGTGGTTIVAPATGRLYKATVDKVNDRSACSQKGWNQWHSFYIVHGTGSSDATFKPNGYSSWYLHVDSLALTVPPTPGYVFVRQGATIAHVGCYGPTTTKTPAGITSCSKTAEHACASLFGAHLTPHLHFEVRKTLPAGTDSVVVDPYADDLWLR